MPPSPREGYLIWENKVYAPYCQGNCGEKAFLQRDKGITGVSGWGAVYTAEKYQGVSYDDLKEKSTKDKIL